MTVTGAGGLNLTPTADYADNTDAGTATASYTFAGDANHTGSSDSKTFTIGKAASSTTVTIVGGPFTYTGSPHTPGDGVGDRRRRAEPDADGRLRQQHRRRDGDRQLHLRRRRQPHRQQRLEDLHHRQGGVDDDGDDRGPARSPTPARRRRPATVTVTGAGGLSLTPTADYANNIDAGHGDRELHLRRRRQPHRQQRLETFTIGKATSTTTVTCSAARSPTRARRRRPATVHVTGVGGLNLTPPPNYANNVNAGVLTATASYSYLGDTNHTGSSESASFTIGQKPATWTTNGASKTLGASDPVPLTTGSGSGFLAADGVAATYTRVGGDTVAGNPYHITATLGATGLLTNYTITNVGASFTIGYATTGMCLGSPGHQVLQPLNIDGTSVVKKGSTVPVKFRVCDANGNSIGTAGVVTNFQLVQTIDALLTTTVNEDPLSTTPDAAFRWSPSDQQWIFNLSTKNLGNGKTYVYRITLNDGSTINFQFGTKQ